MGPNVDAGTAIQDIPLCDHESTQQLGGSEPHVNDELFRLGGPCVVAPTLTVSINSILMHVILTNMSAVSADEEELLEGETKRSGENKDLGGCSEGLEYEVFPPVSGMLV